MKAIVIGAGVIGSAVAYRLSKECASVTILEAGRVGGGTSGVSFAWTNAHNKPPRPYHDLNVAGMRAHAALKHEFGSSPWFHQVGCIEWPETEEEGVAQAENFDRLRSWGYAAEWITKDRLRELEPDIDPKAVGYKPVAFYPEEGWLDPVVYADAMIKAAQSRGAKLVTGVKVTSIESRNDRATGVRAADGTVYEADVVVNCAGRWADRIAQDPGVRIPLAPTVGFLVFTPPVATSVSRPILGAQAHVRPDGAGRLMMRRNDADDLVTLETTPSPTLPAAIRVMEGAAEMLPGLRGVMPEAARITARPIPKDGLSAVGPVPRADGYYMVVTHSGVTLSPFLAQAAADEIVHGKICPELETFRPSRFFN